MNVHDSTLCNYHKRNPGHGSSLHFSVKETVMTGAIGGEGAVSDRETQDWVPLHIQKHFKCGFWDTFEVKKYI